MSTEEARSLIFQANMPNPENDAMCKAINRLWQAHIIKNFGSMQHWQELIMEECVDLWVRGDYPATSEESFPKNP